MSLSINDRMPAGEMITPGPDGPTKRDASDLFAAGRKVVLFGVPGAFTPTCTISHLPTFLERYDDLKAQGVDEIAVVSVNDVFVVKAWMERTGGEGKITYLADPQAHYVRQLGLDMDIPAFGGTRSKRFAMLVEDGVIRQLMTEDSPGESSKTDADAILAAMG